MKRKSIVDIKEASFEELTSRRQRADLNTFLCERLGAPPGTQVECRVVRIERPCGIHSADLRATWEGTWFDFNVRFANAISRMTVSLGWRSKTSEPLELHLQRSA